MVRFTAARRSSSKSPTGPRGHLPVVVGDHKLLYLFALADTQAARRRDEPSRREPASSGGLSPRRTGCFERPTDSPISCPFPVFHQQEPNLHYVPFEDTAAR